MTEFLYPSPDREADMENAYFNGELDLDREPRLDLRESIICVSDDRERYGGTYVAVFDYSGSTLAGNAKFDADYYRVSDDFDVPKFFDEQILAKMENRATNYELFMEKAEFFKSVRGVPQKRMFGLQHMVASMFGDDSVVADKDPKWKFIKG